LNRLSDIEAPSTDEEVWRYSRIGELDLDRYTPLKRQRAVDTVVERDLAAFGPMSAVVVVRNGWLVDVTLNAEAADAGVTVGPIADLDDGADHLGAALDVPVDLFGHLNRAFAGRAGGRGHPAGRHRCRVG